MRSLVLVCLAAALATPAHADPEASWRAAAETLRAGGVNAISFRSLPDGVERVAIGADKQHRLASVTKLFLAGAALTRLGGAHRFETEFFATDVRGSTGAPSVGSLYVRGSGDPFLLVAEWDDIAARLPIGQLRGDIVIDDSYFADEPGITYELVPNPYNAPSGAVSAEFNRIAVQVHERTATAYAGTRLTPFTMFDIKPSNQRVINIQERLVGDRLKVQLRGPFNRRSYGVDFHIGHQHGAAAYYAGHLLELSLAGLGRLYAAPPKIRRAPTPADAVSIFRFQAPRTLAEVLTALMRYSNNFIANQLFLALGATELGAPATAAKGRATISQALSELGGLDEVKLVDGSGLDPGNRASARAITRFLAAARTKAPELVELLPARGGGAARAKSGTFKDKNVRALAGYLVDRCGVPYAAFAFLCDGRCSRATARLYDTTLVRIAAESEPPSSLLCVGTSTSTRTDLPSEED